MGVTSEGVTSGHAGSHWDSPCVLIRADDISRTTGKLCSLVFVWVLSVTVIFPGTPYLLSSGDPACAGQSRGVCAHAVAEETLVARGSYAEGVMVALRVSAGPGQSGCQQPDAYITSLQHMTTPVLPRPVCLSGHSSPLRPCLYLWSFGSFIHSYSKEPAPPQPLGQAHTPQGLCKGSSFPQNILLQAPQRLPPRLLSTLQHHFSSRV